jgi:UDP-glucose 4-epimerase
MVIPRFVEHALKGDKLPVYGDGKQSRCFMHVQDAVEAIIRLSENSDAVGKVFNVGGTDEISIYELAVKIVSMLSENADPTRHIEQIPYDQAYAAGFEDMRRRVPDISKIKALTGWQPALSLDSILRDVIAEKTPA